MANLPARPAKGGSVLLVAAERRSSEVEQRSSQVTQGTVLAKSSILCEIRPAADVFLLSNTKDLRMVRHHM